MNGLCGPEHFVHGKTRLQNGIDVNEVLGGCALLDRKGFGRGDVKSRGNGNSGTRRSVRLQDAAQAKASEEGDPDMAAKIDKTFQGIPLGITY